jgi:hypothetical protein
MVPCLDLSHALTAGRTGKWGEDEDSMLCGCRTNARGQGLGPTTRWSRRTKHQRVVRDGGILIPARLRTADAWANGGEDEDSMLKAAVQMHGDKDWVPLPRWSRVEPLSVL